MKKTLGIAFAVILLAAGITYSQGQNFGGGSLPVGMAYTQPTLTLSSAGNGNGALSLSGNTSGAVTLTAPAVAGTATNPATFTNTIQIPSGTVYQWNADTGLSRDAVGIIDAGNGTAGNKSAFFASGNKAFVTSDFTDANSAALQAITGLSFALPSDAINFSFHCQLMYSQATPVAGDQFGIGIITTAPTQANAFGVAYTNTAAAPAPSAGILNGLASTTPTAVVTFTPVPSTVLGATLDGTVEFAGGGAATFNIYVLNGTAADVIVVKRGSYCALY